MRIRNLTFQVRKMRIINRFFNDDPFFSQHVLADCWVTKSSELGINDDTIHCRTHLGHLLQPGDTVLG